MTSLEGIFNLRGFNTRILHEKLLIYQGIIDKWGLRDYQVMSQTFGKLSYAKLLYTFLHGWCVLMLASIPSLILNAPVGFAANYFAVTEAKKDLLASRVKINARDVLLSKKILFSIVAVPTLWIMYAVLLCLLTNLELQTIVVLLMCCPFFSYLGVMAVQAGIVDLKDLRPAYLRLLPSFRRECRNLPLMRVALQREVRNIVRKYGPDLGPLYYAKDNSWENVLKSNLSQSLAT